MQKFFRFFLAFLIVFAIGWGTSACASGDTPTKTAAKVIVKTSSPAASNTTETKEPFNMLIGNWVFENQNISFTAKVTEDTIRVDLNSGGSEGLYWLGTFQSSADRGESITSKGDVAALSRSLFGSQDSEKVFNFVDGKLVFRFTMMGVTKSIELEKK